MVYADGRTLCMRSARENADGTATLPLYRGTSQGLNAALLDGADSLKLLFRTPNQGRYSPLWDVFPAAWTDAAIGAGGFIVNCPIVSSD